VCGGVNFNPTNQPTEETAKKLGSCCWWAGFVAALHIDIDEMPRQIRRHLENVARPFKKGYSNLSEQANKAVDKAELEEKPQDNVTSYVRAHSYLKN